MKEAKISIICAIAQDRAIGKDNKLLWHISNDLKRFKKVTEGHPVIMGQKTFDSLPSGSLSNRVNIVLNPDKNKKIDGCIVTSSIEDGVKVAKEEDKEEIFIIGGGSIYAQTIKIADKLYLTVVDGEYEADTYFPD